MNNAIALVKKAILSKTNIWIEPKSKHFERNPKTAKNQAVKPTFFH